jgi:hypothetical protein
MWSCSSVQGSEIESADVAYEYPWGEIGSVVNTTTSFDKRAMRAYFFASTLHRMDVKFT